MTTIYLLSDGEQWSYNGETRNATQDDVQNYEEYGVELGDIITVLDNGDMEVSSDLYVIEVTDEELERIEMGLEPRKITDYYNRVRELKNKH